MNKIGNESSIRIDKSYGIFLKQFENHGYIPELGLWKFWESMGKVSKYPG
jgi:hypothetical protein